jgi:sugar-specific transcriptional regulator TrmB
LELSGRKRFEEMVSVLTELGMSTTEARIYLTLLKINVIPAKKISEISGVLPPDTYRGLSHLQSEGFVNTILGRPKKFQAIPPKECISILSKRRKKALAQLKDQALSTIHSLSGINNNSQEKDEFIIIPKKETLYNKGRKMINAAENSICILGTSRKLQSYIFSERESLEKALSRKVTFMLIIESANVQKPERIPDEFWSYPNFNVLFSCGPIKASFGVYDRKEILLSRSVEDVAYEKDCIWSNNESLVGLAQDYFDLYWTLQHSSSHHPRIQHA